MKVAEITIKIDSTIPTGNYQNVKPGVEIKVNVEDGDNIADVMESIMTSAVESLRVQIKKHFTKAG